MTIISSHPSREKLSAYSLGQLPEDQAIAIDSHISECEPCCETIVELSAEDTFACLLHEVGNLESEQIVDQSVSRSKQSVRATGIPEPLLEHPRYQVVRLIGKGGMGDVYEARHRKMDRTVAIKVITGELFRKRAVIDRFHREVQTAAKLSHPNIVASYDADQAGDFHFLVMEYVDGVDLSQFIKSGKELPISEAVEYIRQAAIGLQHAHEMGMVHRDIKPHNLMVSSDGTVKILDFGLASLAPEAIAETDTVEARGDLTAVGSIMGTPDFISPEQAGDARQADIRSDIYSLGVTLYYLLSGRPPFEDGSVMQKLKNHAQTEPDALETIRDDIPSELVNVVSKMMAKDPNDRFQTPAEVAEALDYLEQEAGPTESLQPQPQVKPLQQTPRFLPLTAITTLFVLTVAAAIVFYIQTNNGVIRVKVLDESLAVKVNGQTIKMNEGNKEITIRAGEQRQLVVSQDGSDFELVTDKFLIRRGDEIVFDVDLVRGDLVVVKDGEQFDRMKVMPPSIESSDKPPKAVADRATDADVAKAKEFLGFNGDVTPETMIAAFDAGLFAYPLEKAPPEWEQPSSWGGPIRLMTSVRGESGKETLFSPFIDLLSVVAKPNGAMTEESILNLDGKLVELCEQRGRYRIEAGVAATVFAFQRGDLKSAMKRLKDLKFNGNYFHSSHRTPFDLNLWLAVRNALSLESTEVPVDLHRQEPEETIAVAKQLSEYAVKAARNSDDPRVEQALLRERSKLLQRERLELAKAAFARGDREQANEILRTVPGVGSAGPFILSKMPRFDSDTAVAFKLAELLEEESDWTNAADAYLEVYRGEIELLSADQLPTFKTCGRTSEFVHTLIEANVVKLDAGYLPIKIVESLLNDENTRADGDQLLKHLWANPQSILFGRLLGEPEIWKKVPDLSYYPGKILLPSNFASEGAGWGRFQGQSVAEAAEEPVRGLPLNLKSLPYHKATLRKLAEEVESAIEKHPNWKAGPAVLAYLEAKVGNHQRATELIRQVLADAETRPIPSDSAFLFGMALEGKTPELDREVMRLYESSLRNRPTRVFRASAIPKLARLHAKYNDRNTSRQVLHRLEDVDYDPSGSTVYCSPAFRPESHNRCTECHRGKSNLLDITVMSNNLTDVGYPVDALISLARIDASFANAYGSDEGWETNVFPQDISVNIKRGRSRFTPAKSKAEKAITPQAVLEALKSGVFSGRDMTKPAPENTEVAIDLMTSVRGVDGGSALFSPALEVLELAAKAKGDEASIAIVQIDQLLAEAFDKNPDNVEMGIAATVFAFLRNDLDAAEKRSKKLNAVVAGRESQERDVALWLVARLALANETTRDIGRKLAERALAAAGMRGDELWKEAITRERSTLAAVQQVSPSMEGFLKAKEAYVRAKRLEKSGDIEKAADAYLEAYRGDPTLVAYEQFATIKKAKRVPEFVEVFNADRLLLVPLTGNPVERIAKDLVKDETTRLDGRALLDRMWEARPYDQWPLLGNPPEDTVSQIGDPLLEIRKQPYKNEKRPPTDPDWGRFRANNTYEAIGRNRGLLQKLAPQLKDTVEQKVYLAKPVRDVERTLDQDPQWKAGVAVLAFLEAELGNEQRAMELIETVLADTKNPITCSAAMTFGQALEGKTAALDRLVIRLYEKSVAEWGDFELGEPEYSLNLSPIQNLAALYAKYDRREEARRLLLRLTIPEGIGARGRESKFVTCFPGRVLLDYSDLGSKDAYPKVRTEDQVPEVNCMACHRKERNLFSYLTMSDKLNDLGYPVDARLSLARIDASFGNSYSSDDDWRQAKTPKLYCTSEFQPVSEKIDRAITPQAVLESLESGAFNDIDLTNPVIAKKATSIDLMLSVRGVNGKSTLFSPVVDLLELAVNSKGDEAAVAKIQIDQLLADEFAKHPANVEAGIAATVLAFLRGDFEAAQTRSQELNERVAATAPGQSDIALWLVARLALDNEKTEAIGEALTKRVLAAAEKSADPLFKEAIVREREAIAKIVALRKLSTARDAPDSDRKDLIDTAAAGDVFNTLIAAVKAAGLTDTLSGSGPFTILAPTDDAFAKLPQQTLNDLLKPENKDKLARILKYHVIPSRIPASDVLQADSLVTLIGEPVYVAKQKGHLTINKANVIAADLAASNGFIHVIDEVLIPRGRTLLSQYHDVVEYDWAGKKTWEVKLELPHEFWGLPTGERVVEHIPVDSGNTKDDFGTLHELIIHAAGDGPPRKLWSIPSSLLGARPLPNGQILVWTDEFVQRYDRTGSKLWETEIVWKGQNRLPLGAEPLPNGNLRVLFRTSKETYKTRPDNSVEIDEQGRVVRELPYDPNIKLLQRLPNGNSLALITTDHKDRLLEERDATDKVIWSYTNDSRILTAQRLLNGDTLIGAMGQAKAIDMSGNVTWQPDKSLFKYETAGYESYRYYPVLVPENGPSNERDHRNKALN